MTQPKTNRIPAPIYAAAGAGDLAYQQLRKLPAVVGDLGTKVVADLGGKAVVTGVELRQKANDTLRAANLTAGQLREKAVPADLNRLREVADLDRLREVGDLNKLRAAADLDRLREAADLDKLRALATRNAAVVVAGAQAAQERALAAYGALVARGERVVGAGVLEAAETVNADIEATGSEPAAASAKFAGTTTAEPVQATGEVPTPAEVAEVVEAKPAARKATRGKAAATPSAKLPRAAKRPRPAAE
ncbi:hypothetical protein [Micromonospora deserti]|uniref:Uncharacterized protein n=1 Tax=Micromonospora deserti TaxID=2070366 RepID=A0A2W2DB34_9ACTN|nr:hypothetical protein [Micromonospora deserti]PZF97999.1 hypothetical protein C1I99_14430 [Micromonospora deserti]